MEKNIEKHMEDFNAACAKLNIPNVLPEVSTLPKALQNYHQANHMILILTAAERNGEKLDYNNWNQRKYFPVWDLESKGSGPAAGSGFALRNVIELSTIAAVGAPFVTTVEEKTKSLADKYADLYAYIILPLEI